MRNSHAGAIKGMGIATIILAGLGIVLALFTLVLSGVTGSIIAESGPEIMNSIDRYGDGSDHYYYMYDQEDASMLGTLLALLGGGLSFWVLICAVVALIAGIFAVLNAANPNKLGTVMGWSIAGAVVSLLGGSFITMILLIIIAIFANADKRTCQQQFYQQAPQQPAPPSPGQQPVVLPQQPAPPAPGQQPVTPQQSVAPQRPEPPQDER